MNGIQECRIQNAVLDVNTGWTHHTEGIKMKPEEIKEQIIQQAKPGTQVQQVEPDEQVTNLKKIVALICVGVIIMIVVAILMIVF